MPDNITAYIGLGGNVGDVIANMNKAVNTVHASDEIRVLEISQIYKTPPWGIEDQDWFYNACFSVETTLSATQLLDVCLKTEESLKRTRDIRWGPRTIDLDVLIFGDTKFKSDRLEVPHPRMLERAFVLKPLADIAERLIINERLISEWLARVDCSQMKLTNHQITLQNL